MNQIPKIIHYCWFGGNAKNENIKRCMESWHRHLPDYEIMEWNESNCDIAASRFASGAYKAQKWAFVSDYIRFTVLYKYGGIYLDTDVLVNKPFDDLLRYDAFFPIEDYTIVNGTAIGAIPKCDVIKKILDYYSDLKFIPERMSEAIIGGIITKILVNDYDYLSTGFTQIIEDRIAVLSPNILMVNIYDGKNCCEHLYEASWFINKRHDGYTYANSVMVKYFYNLFGRPHVEGYDKNLNPIKPDDIPEADNIDDLVSVIKKGLEYIKTNPGNFDLLADDINTAISTIALQRSIEPPMMLNRGDIDRIDVISEWLERY